MKVFGLLSVFIVLTGVAVNAQEWKSGVEWDEPPVVTPGATNDMPPSDAIVLFGGDDLSAFENGDQWRIEDGVATAAQTMITSKQKFGSIQLHAEWSAPTEIRGNSQGRGNSGFYLMGLYEVQILDSFENETYFDGQAGSIYKQNPPMVNAMRKPGEWNSYDVFFTAPVFKVNGDVESPAYVTLMHNGILVQNHFELLGPTSYIAAPKYEPHAEAGALSIQFHGNPVRFRNIWVRELKSPAGRRTSAGFNIEPKKPKKEKKAAEDNADESATPVNTESAGEK